MIVYRIENHRGEGMYTGEDDTFPIREHLDTAGVSGGKLFPAPWADDFFTIDRRRVNNWWSNFSRPLFGFKSPEQLSAWVGNFTVRDLSNLERWAYLTKYDVPDNKLIYSKRQVVFEGCGASRISQERFNTQTHITKGN